MFKQGYPPDGLANSQTEAVAASSMQMPPPNTFNMQFNVGSTGFSPFVPEYHQFPYTFSSATPPMYSWANTNSTDIMKFTGSCNPRPLDTSAYHHSNFGMVPKRKIDSDTELPQPPKMRITEEKVSASLRDMHISNEFKPHNCCFDNNVGSMDTMESSMNIISTNETTQTETQSTLVMCEELRKLNKIDSIIPQPLLNIERPNNAVVLWKPQPLRELVNPYSYYKEPESTVIITEITDEEEVDINNQDEMLVEDNNCMFEDDMEL